MRARSTHEACRPLPYIADPPYTACLRLLRCPTGLVHAASKYRGGDGALTHKFLPAANAPGRCLACSRLSGIVAIALVVMFEFELDQRTLDWSIHFDSSVLCEAPPLSTRCRI